MNEFKRNSKIIKVCLVVGIILFAAICAVYLKSL